MNGNPESGSTPKEGFCQASESVRGTLEKTRFFERSDWLSFGATAALVLSVYLFTLAPDVTLGSSGAFSVGAMYAGVPVPPGYPLWTIYAHFFTLLPFSSVAWRAGLSSAIAGALTCGVIALMASRGGPALIEAISQPGKLRQGEIRALRVVSSCVAGMAFGFDGAFWRTAVVADPGPLRMLLFAIVLCLLMRWVHVPSRRRSLYGASFVYGLAFTNSQMLLAAAPGLQLMVVFGHRKLIRDICMVNAVLFIACLMALRAGYLEASHDRGGKTNIFGILFFVVGVGSIVTCMAMIAGTRRLFTEWKTILNCGVMILLGLTVYLYEPVASMTNPPINWAYPRTPDGFLHLVTRGQFERLHPTSHLAGLVKQLQMCAEITVAEFGLLYVLVALVPFYYLRRLDAYGRRWMMGLLAVYVSLALFIPLVLNPPRDARGREHFMVSYSASHLVLAVWTGYGLVALGALFTSSHRLTQSTAFNGN
ncbi:MAG TPA: DUF2723 domain-containing protein [Candidatus Angelobacter sp.]|nr:DUF2723 domain-containing protein [Candidatus Angelobacter sp.]